MSGHYKSIAAYAMMAVLAFGLATCKKEKIDPPTVKVFDGVITIGITKASVSAEVTDQGGAEVKSRGFVYGLLGGNLDTVFCGSGTGIYSAELNNLLPNTTYVYEAFAKNTGGIGVSENVTFTTNPLPSFSIVVSANPSNGGVVSGGGSFQEGQPCTIMAMANDGYTFTNWTENDIEVSSNMNYTFVVNSDRTLKANFVVQEPNTYDISVSANPTNGGSVYVGDVPGMTHNIYNQGQSCTVHATANEGYSFTYWTENGQVVTGADADYTFNVTGNRNLEARFTQNDYTINVVARPPQGGTVTGGGVFHYGDQTTLTATANHDYEFHGWDDGITTNPRIITVTGTATYTAVFGEIGTSYYNVYATVDPSGAGYVTGAGPFPAGDTTILKAVPNPGYTFSQWQDGNTQNPRAVIVNSPLSFTAYFTQNQYTIHTYVSPTGTGIVIGGGTYHYGDQPTLSAIANDGYIFDHWSDGVTQNPRQITVTSEATYTAYFTQAPPAQYTITTIVIPDGAGTVEGGGAYPEGTMVTLMAYAFEGYTFDQWQDGSTQNPRQITVTSNATYTAYFSQASHTPYTITTNVIPDGAGTVDGGGTYPEGTMITLTADAFEGYTFDHWQDGSTQNPRNITVTGNATYTAHFTQASSTQYTINVSANPTGGGTVMGGGIYQQGDTCTVTATHADGYIFLRWTENDNEVSIEASYTFTVTSDRTLVANFTAQAPNTYTINVSTNPVEGGTATGGGTYEQGESCTVNATAASGYSFTNWTENGDVVSTNPDYFFNVYGNRSLVANFTQQSQAPTGAINGRFSVNSSQKVYFSQGNLQYKASTDTWRFATNQYDCIGSDNSNISSSYSGWIDLFGWGTSGWNNGNIYYYPWCFEDNGNYLQGYGYGPTTNGSYIHNLTGAYANADWGVFNQIINGGNITNTWRTLTQSEWKYIFNSRNASTVNGVPNARYAKAKVADVHGVILFPDTYTHPSSVAQPTGINQTGDTGWNGNNYTFADFNLMQIAGAVFLPAAGQREGISFYGMDSTGYYWSTTCEITHAARGVYFHDNYFSESYLVRYFGYSVRLVCPAN